MPNDILSAQAGTATTESVAPIVEQSPTAAQLIKNGQFEELLDQFLTGSIDFLGKVLIALLIFYLGRWIIKQIDKVFKRMLNRRVDDIALRSFLMNILNIALFATLIILIINIVGTKPVSLVALIGSIGLAVGLAVKDSSSTNLLGVVITLKHKMWRAPYNRWVFSTPPSQPSTTRRCISPTDPSPPVTLSTIAPRPHAVWI